MVQEETMNEPAMLTQLALTPVCSDYSQDLRFGNFGRQDGSLPPDLLPVLMFGDEDGEEEEDMDEDENFDDMDEDFDDDFDDDEDDFDEEDEDYDEEEDDYDYEEDVDYDDFDE